MSHFVPPINSQSQAVASAAASAAASTDLNSPCILLLLLCGLPAAGKSSVTRMLPLEIAKQLSSPCSVHSLSFDDIYSELQRVRRASSPSKLGQSNQEGSTETEVKVFEPALWRESRNIAAELTEAIIRSITASASSSSQRQILVLDDNFYLRSMRHRFYQIAREHRTRFLQLYIDTPVEVAIERNKHRLAAHGDQAQSEFSRMHHDDQLLLQQILTKPATVVDTDLQSTSALASSSSSESSPSLLEDLEVNEGTIRKMSAAFEVPPFDLTQDEHSRNWEKFSYRVRSNTSDDPSTSIIPWSVLHEALSSDKFIPPLLADPVVEAERLTKARQETHASLLHNLDLQSRRCIQQKMQSMLATPGIEKTAIQQAAATWNVLRKSLLADAKKTGTRVYELIQDAAQQSAINDPLQSTSSDSPLAVVMREFEAKLI